MYKQRGFTLVELAIIAAIVGAIIAAVVGVNKARLDAATKQACLSQITTPLGYHATWIATVTPDNPDGDFALCRSYKVAADAWNSQCDKHMSPLASPAVCKAP